MKRKSDGLAIPSPSPNFSNDTDLKLQNITLEVARGLVDWVSEHSIDAVLQLAVITLPNGERNIPFMIIDNFPPISDPDSSEMPKHLQLNPTNYQKILFYFRPNLPKLNPFDLGEPDSIKASDYTDEYQLIKDLKKLYYYSERKSMAFSRLKVRVWKGSSPEWEFQMEYKYNDHHNMMDKSMMSMKSMNFSVMPGIGDDFSQSFSNLKKNVNNICSEFFENWIGKVEDEVSLKHIFSRFVCLALEKQETFKHKYEIDDTLTYKASEIKSWKLNPLDGTIQFYIPELYSQKFRIQILGTLTNKSWLRADELHPAKLPFHLLQISKQVYKLANTQAELVIKELLNRRIDVTPNLFKTSNSQSNMHTVNYFGHMICSVVSILFHETVIAYFRCVNPMMPQASTWILLTEDLSSPGMRNKHDDFDNKFEKIETIFTKAVMMYGNLIDHFDAYLSYIQLSGFTAIIKNYPDCSQFDNFSLDEAEMMEREKWVVVLTKRNTMDEKDGDHYLFAMFDEYRRYRGFFGRK